MNTANDAVQKFHWDVIFLSMHVGANLARLSWAIRKSNMSPRMCGERPASKAASNLFSPPACAHGESAP
eukprot:6180971-Pleurochrysis_carterae.AAC.3